MAQQPGYPHTLPAGFGHQVVLVPAPPETFELAEPLAPFPGRPAVPGRRVQARTRAIRQVVVIEVAGRLVEVAGELDRAIQLALADGPRGVVCDLSNVLDAGDPGALEVLATAGRHNRDWPGVHVAVACPDPAIREALGAHDVGGYLMVTASLFSAVFAVLATPTLHVQRLHLSAHPTAPRAAREFVTRTLLDWRLGRLIPAASLLVSELVASSAVHTGTDMVLCVAWGSGALRLSVRDRCPALPPARPSILDVRGGRARTVVAGLSRAFGVLPTADGGKVTWAVLEAPQPRP
jgi:hypothetical protein